jgi:hypothetical protein
MTKDEILEIIREELAAVLQEMQKPEEEELDERTVASREPPRKMTKGQVQGRDKIGKKLLKNKRSVRYFKDNFGDDWKSYLYATATNRAIDSKKKNKAK